MRPDSRTRGIAARLVNRETVSYAVTGVITSIINIGIFELLLLARADYRAANVVALIVTKFCAYFFNKRYVFRTETAGKTALAAEFGRFMLARMGTMALDWAALVLLVSGFGVNEHAGKIVTTILVVIMNYVLGKFLVFTGKKKTS